MRWIGLVLALLLVGCDDDKKPPVVFKPPPQTSVWQIGPIVNGQNYSVGMPATMDVNNSMMFPACPGHVNYVSKATGPISGTMRLTYRAEGVLIAPTQGATAYVSLYFQRHGDNWSGAGPMESFRWYHVGDVVADGDHTIEAPLTPEAWGNVMGKNGTQDPNSFNAAMQAAELVGFVFGDPGAGATGHGVCGTGQFIVLDFAP